MSNQITAEPLRLLLQDYESLISRVSALENKVTRLESQQQTTPSSTLKAQTHDPATTIYLRFTEARSYIKVVLNNKNLGLISKSLSTLSLKKFCEIKYNDLWKEFVAKNPKNWDGGTPHGGSGYGGTASLKKQEAIELFESVGFTVVDETADSSLSN